MKNLIVAVYFCLGFTAISADIGEKPIFSTSVKFFKKDTFDKLPSASIISKIHDSFRNLPFLRVPFLSLTHSENADVFAIDEAKSSLEVNGYQVIDLSTNTDFVNLLNELHNLSFPCDPEKLLALKKSFLDKLIPLVNEHLKKSGKEVRPLMDERDVRLRSSKKNDDKQQEDPIEFLHIDYLDKEEAFRLYKFKFGNAFKPPQEKNVELVNITVPTNAFNGMPLAMIDRVTVDGSRDRQPAFYTNEQYMDSELVGMSSHFFVDFDNHRHKLRTIENWWLGKIIIFFTVGENGTFHTAVKRNEEPRTSGEIRCALISQNKK
jgi:hypothetical protein